MMRPLSNPCAVAMAREDGVRSGGVAPTEPSLADGTGEGNAPIDGTSASSDPQVLAGTQQDPNATSLNDDDYPEDLAEAAGPVEGEALQFSLPGAENMSGQTTPDDAAPGGECGRNPAAAVVENAEKT